MTHQKSEFVSTKGQNDNPVLFPWGRASQFGFEMAHKLQAEMDGGPMSFPQDMAVVAQMIFNGGGGDHVEIGTGFGFSAVIAALTMKHFNLPGKVYCVDPLTGKGINTRDELTAAELGRMEEYVRSNLKRFDVEDRVELVKSLSFPFPIPGHKFSTAFVDGDHSFEGVAQDWFSLKDVVENYIAFHDYGSHYFGVVTAVWRYPMSNPWWVPVHISTIVCVMRNLLKRTMI